MISIEYLAGFFDGEGYVGVAKHRSGNYILQMSISNTELLLLQSIQAEYGGKIHLSPERRSQIRKPAYHIHWWGIGVKNMATLLLPYTKIKGSQLKLALEFPVGKRGGWQRNSIGRFARDQTTHKKREEIYVQMKREKGIREVTKE